MGPLKLEENGRLGNKIWTKVKDKFLSRTEEKAMSEGAGSSNGDKKKHQQ